MNIEELTKKYFEQYSYSNKENILYIRESDAQIFIQDETKVKYQNVSISIILLKNLLENDSFFSYIQKLFKNQISNLYIVALTENKNNGLIESCWRSDALMKGPLLESFDLALRKKENLLMGKGQKRLEEISSLANQNALISDFANKNVYFEIEGELYSLQVLDFFNKFLLLPDEDFMSFFDVKKENQILGIPKDHFVYQCSEFIKNHDILIHYFLPKVGERMEKINSFQLIDFEYLEYNDFLVKPDYLKEVVINQELRNYVDKDLPDSFDALERLYFRYLKLCKILIYDDTFFVYRQTGEYAKRYKDVTHIKKVTPKQNKTVCYETNAILAKFMEEDNLKFQITCMDSTYASSHDKIIGIYEKFIIELDPTLEGDFLNARLNVELQGFRLVNKNENTKKEFIEKVGKVYNYLIGLENQKQDYTSNMAYGFEDTYYQDSEYLLVAEMQKKYEFLEEQKLPTELKVEFFLELLSYIKMPYQEKVEYAVIKKHQLFTEEEINNFISLVWIKENMDVANVHVSMIFSYSKKGNIYGNNLEYYYIGKNKVYKIKKEELQEKFDNSTFEYIEGTKTRIPGIFGNNSRKL